ncbi:type IV secretory system conjugative DNA transfer family protein [Caproicibacter fermentans]|uniref:Type IV secretory system conjugative DNA transfer family protein n=1 Tax=Caproicibacter fermentans TaxID=2576756 RepID=A0A7G8TD81_9FIRM|nr:type IV secretory system conjugative DNA transfer family protein [Caproicibacter fermentans]QNK41572.1 type IV secretory system conjugative DNA transfer family protein [Caproicibacter fermentans]
MDYVTVCGIIILICGFAFDIWKTIKGREASKDEHDGIKDNDNKNRELLSKDSEIRGKDHDRLSEEHNRLSEEHDRISSELTAKHDDLKGRQESIVQSTSDIRTSVVSIDKQLAVEQAKREAMLESMSANQRDIHSQINAIYALNQLVPKLEYKNQALSEKYENLQNQYNDLKIQHQDLLTKYQALKQERQEHIEELTENSKIEEDLSQDGRSRPCEIQFPQSLAPDARCYFYAVFQEVTDMLNTIAMVIGIASIMGIAVLVFVDRVKGNLNIKSKTVGDGQYGTARWATPNEIRKTYQIFPYEPMKWRQGKHLPDDVSGATVLGYVKAGNRISARVDTSDSHTLILSTTGGRKTTGVLYPNLEYACACGVSFIVTDTKGDSFRDYAGIAQKYYHYNIAVIDLRHPTRSSANNLMHLVNKYMDSFKDTGDLQDKAKAERYAKIVAKTIVHMDGFVSGGQNAFFYDAAEGLISSTILLVSEFCKDGERHIVSVFKIIQELLQVKTPVMTTPSGQKVKPKNEYQKLIEMLPAEHKARWLAGAALISPEASMHSVMSTAMSRLLSFIDSELEQVLCFDSEIDAEKFCNEKTAIFIVFPEEDETKYFLVSLFVTQLYNECLSVASQNDKNRLPRRINFYLDEFGTMNKFDNAVSMFTAGKSRNIIMYPMIQSLSQLQEKYGREGGDIIVDCCTNVLIGGFSPLSKGAEEVSRALGNQTVQSGSINHSSNGAERRNDSISMQMIPQPLMTAEKILHMPDNQWILMKTRRYPTLTVMKRFNEWGIQLDCPYHMPENAARTVHYASAENLKQTIAKQFLSSSIPEQKAPATGVHKEQISDDFI